MIFSRIQYFLFWRDVKISSISGIQSDMEHYKSLGEVIHEILESVDAGRLLMINTENEEQHHYGDFKQSAIIFAQILTKLGVQRHDVVSIISENNYKYFVPLISAIYIGAEVNAINPNYVECEYIHCLSITKPKVVFCSTTSLKAIISVKNEIPSIEHIIVFDGPLNEEVLHFDTLLDENINNETSLFKPLRSDPNDTSFILFSSGTTGLPKGVTLTDANMRHHLLTYICKPNSLNVNENSIIIGLLPWFHIFGLLISLACLIHKAKLLLYSKFKPDTFLNVVQDYKVNNLFVVPPILVFLAKAPIVEEFDLTSVENIFCGAAPLGKSIEKEIERRFENVAPQQLYGLTETGACTCILKNEPRYGSVGKVIEGYDVKVCDVENNFEVAPNAVGEILVRGKGVMKGYLGNKKETDEIFTKDGFLHTGDLGYFDADGYLYIIDRLKEIIKYKGFQVPPALLEKILLQHNSLKDACVVGKPDERAGEVPVAFVVKIPNSDVTEEEIVDFVAKHVSPEKQLYGGVKFVEEIPKNPSGKILRRILRDKLIKE